LLCHFADWLRVIRVLSREQQELLLSYYLLGKPQIVLSKLPNHPDGVFLPHPDGVKLAGPTGPSPTPQE